MPVLAWVGVVLLAIVAGALLSSRAVLDSWFRKMLHPPMRTPRALPVGMAQRAEDVTISGEREPLKAWLVWPSGSGLHAARRADGIAVFIHGWSSDGGRMAPLASQVLDAGVACLLVDLPGHGRTGRAETYNAKLMVDDLAAVRDWIAQRNDLAAMRCAILGYSFGGVGAIVAAARDRRWDALVVMAAPVGPMQALEIYLEGKRVPVRWVRGPLYRSARRVIGVDPDSFSGAHNLRELTVPALFVHGERDDVVPFRHAVELHASAPEGRAELALFAEAGHDGLLVDQEAGRCVAAFLSRSLAGVPTRVGGE